MSNRDWMEQRQKWRREIERLEKLLVATEDPADKASFAASLSLPSSGDGRDALHAAIMNLPSKAPNLLGNTVGMAYNLGHRDARHAAAELVAAMSQGSSHV